MVLVVDHTLVRVSRSQGGVLGLVDPATPDVDHRLTMEVDGHRRADIGPGIEVGGQRLAHPVESSLAGAFHFSHRLSPLDRQRERFGRDSAP